jgi:hypothetical protein
MRRIQYIAVAAMLAVSAMLGGCGDNTAPSGATITIYPASFSLEDAAAVASSSSKDFTITVKNKDGLLMNNVDVVISAIAQQWGYAQLMTTRNVLLPEPVTVTTDDTGTYTVRLSMVHGGGAKYKFDLNAVSASASASATIEIK